MPALDEEQPNPRMGCTAARRERLRLPRWKKIGPLAECGVVLLNILAERRNPRLGLHYFGAGVKRRHRAAECVRERRVDFARLRQPVEHCILVEAAHFECPYDWSPAAVEFEPPVSLAGDRHHAPIDIRRERVINAKFLFASAFAL